MRVFENNGTVLHDAIRNLFRPSVPGIHGILQGSTFRAIPFEILRDFYFWFLVCPLMRHFGIAGPWTQKCWTLDRDLPWSQGPDISGSKVQAHGQQAIQKCPLIISNEPALTLIHSCIGSCHGQILIETKTDTLLDKLGNGGGSWNQDLFK